MIECNFYERTTPYTDDGGTPWCKLMQGVCNPNECILQKILSEFDIFPVIADDNDYYYHYLKQGRDKANAEWMTRCEEFLRKLDETPSNIKDDDLHGFTKHGSFLLAKKRIRELFQEVFNVRESDQREDEL